MTVISAASLVEDVSRPPTRAVRSAGDPRGMPAYLAADGRMVEGWPDNERLLAGRRQAILFLCHGVRGAEDAAFRDARLLRAKTSFSTSPGAHAEFQLPHVPFGDYERQVGQMTRSDVPYGVLDASCWGNWIGAHSNSITALRNCRAWRPS